MAHLPSQETPSDVAMWRLNVRMPASSTQYFCNEESQAATFEVVPPEVMVYLNFRSEMHARCARKWLLKGMRPS